MIRQLSSQLADSLRLAPTPASSEEFNFLAVNRRVASSNLAGEPNPSALRSATCGSSRDWFRRFYENNDLSMRTMTWQARSAISNLTPIHFGPNRTGLRFLCNQETTTGAGCTWRSISETFPERRDTSRS